jgi:DUF1365 family protein
MSASCIYEGTLRHRRYELRRREFTHRLALAYVDLDELPGLLGGRLVEPRPGFLRFRRRDYFGDGATPLERAVRTEVGAHTGAAPSGPVRVLTQLRSWGHCFNPVSFYYCMGEDGDLEAMLGEVTNTPWGERASYVLAAGKAHGGVISGEFDKHLHVSPFFGMDHRYSWRASAPGETLSVHIENRREGKLAFDATLNMRRVELTRTSAARMAARYPLASIRVLGLIYGHAVGLKLAGIPVHRNPRAERKAPPKAAA